LNTTKFRKCKCNEQETALQKIQQWMEKFWCSRFVISLLINNNGERNHFLH
jgi:hypothetical protein